MAENKKMTRAELMGMVREVIVEKDPLNYKEDILALIDKTIEGYSKKSVSKADKTRLDENNTIAQTILEVLANGRMRTATVTKEVNAKLGTDYNVQRVQSQMSILRNNGELVRTMEKGNAYYELAPTETEETEEVTEEVTEVTE